MPVSDIYKNALNSIRNNFNSELALYSPSLPTLNTQHVIYGDVEGDTKDLDTTGIVGEPIIIYDIQHGYSNDAIVFASSILTLRLKICFRETTRDEDEAVKGYLLDYSQVLRNIFLKSPECGSTYFEGSGIEKDIDNNIFIYTLSLNIQFHYA